MAGLSHALLTEDECVLLRALEPAREDRILALFAYGNGDAALAMLQNGPATVCAHDFFDHGSLVAQLRLKQWLFQNLSCASLRRFIGIEPGFDPAKRSEIVEAFLREAPGPASGFWLKRLPCLRRGIAISDGTYKWSRTLRHLIAIYRRLPSAGQKALLGASIPLASLYFPHEERAYSLGYRQLRSNPHEALRRMTDRFHNLAGAETIISYRDFSYIAHRGHRAIRTYLDRLETRDQLPPNSTYNKAYLSNLIDYTSHDGFSAILNKLLPVLTRPWLIFLNSTYASTSWHPHLRTGLREGVFTVDAPRTLELRGIDRVGVYPGLTVLRNT